MTNGRDIHWKCSKCNKEGKIRHWRKTSWDNLEDLAKI